MLGTLETLTKFLGDGRKSEVKFLGAFLGGCFVQIFLADRLYKSKVRYQYKFKRYKASLPIEVRRSKTPSQLSGFIFTFTLFLNKVSKAYIPYFSF